MCIVINMLMTVIQLCKSKEYSGHSTLNQPRSGSMSAFIAYLQLVDPTVAGGTAIMLFLLSTCWLHHDGCI